MSPDKQSKQTKLCPTCGTRVQEDAARCLVCGADLSIPEQPERSEKAVQARRMPAITLSLPAVLGLIILLLLIGATAVFFAMNQNTRQPTTVAATETLTPTLTLTPTVTFTPLPPTSTSTPLPSPTPITYVVKLGDNCGGIAIAFGVSIQSIVTENPLLAADCRNIFEGQILQIPHPTPTVTPLPTSTLNAQQATIAACEIVEYKVKENDTLGGIAANYQVPKEAISEWNGLVNDFVRFDEVLKIPICKRLGTPEPTATATPPPPYTAPELLLPADGAVFTSADDTIPLQWTLVGTLRDNEAYAVVIENLTEGKGEKEISYVTDTKYLVPTSFKPTSLAQVFRWWVIPVRQIGTNKEGEPVWESAGATSVQRVFVWIGSGSTPATTIP
jgi:LysM repeat protein